MTTKKLNLTNEQQKVVDSLSSNNPIITTIPLASSTTFMNTCIPANAITTQQCGKHSKPLIISLKD